MIAIYFFSISLQRIVKFPSSVERLRIVEPHKRQKLLYHRVTNEQLRCSSALLKQKSFNCVPPYQGNKELAPSSHSSKIFCNATAVLLGLRQTIR